MKMHDLLHRFVGSATDRVLNNTVYMVASLAPLTLPRDSTAPGHELIDLSLDSAMTIVYGDQEAAAVNNQDDSAAA